MVNDLDGLTRLSRHQAGEGIQQVGDTVEEALVVEVGEEGDAGGLGIEALEEPRVLAGDVF